MISKFINSRNFIIYIKFEMNKLVPSIEFKPKITQTVCMSFSFGVLVT